MLNAAVKAPRPAAPRNDSCGGRRAKAPTSGDGMATVATEIGKLARPAEIRFTEALPKTRSGKIMRRLLRDIAAGVETVGDTSTIEDYGVLAKLRNFDE